ncbi:Spermatogenesis-associated protein 19, mitochondrial [Tupaia chinensis]|uniref:Spermatogenesis-associated protein 19, mitochondrial n=1 Tax=Tupaia chinensis TaxID=246437 RepID=L9KQ17_TUPCH|nr:Spermatogenesis-associated protein 19, mitochondrial [Tupaia chinensis]
MIITTWIVYILARKGAGLPFPPRISSDIEVVESEAVSVVQHWLKKVKHHLSKSDLSANQSQEVLEERTRIQFIRWSHTRIFQVPSEVTDEVMRDRIEQVEALQGQGAGLCQKSVHLLLDLKSNQTWAQRCQPVADGSDSAPQQPVHKSSAWSPPRTGSTLSPRGGEKAMVLVEVASLLSPHIGDPASRFQIPIPVATRSHVSESKWTGTSNNEAHLQGPSTPTSTCRRGPAPSVWGLAP